MSVFPLALSHTLQAAWRGELGMGKRFRLGGASRSPEESPTVSDYGDRNARGAIPPGARGRGTFRGGAVAGAVPG